MTATVVSAVTAAFLASFVEVVEAFTIVLAVGLTQGWRPALVGSGLALLVLVALVLLFGPLLALIPIGYVQFLVGVLLILFGLRWLRKAILRSTGVIALRDEAKNFAAETVALSQRRSNTLAGTVAFKAVLLEGVEVIFIVIAIGTTRGLTLYAGLGALAAVVVVMAIGVALHRPLSQVPENSLKFVVGLMLTSFGVFWTGEGIGANWPGADLALPVIFAIMALASWAILRFARRTHRNAIAGATP
ncbi:MAG TPA: hypothetical protein VL147_17135 [Devosia sp.]|nr:hypothetical protein [Devosia sp.]